MNNWYQMRRLRGAIILILIGVLALLNQWHIMRFEVSWPLILIVLGLMKIAERAAWAADVREQQIAQPFGPNVTSASGSAYGSFRPANPIYSSASSPTVGADQPIIQPTPTAPPETSREDS